MMALLCLTPACDKQAQGERCDQLNGNDDCQDGLVCTPGSQVGQKKDVCCPSTLSEATDPRCTQGGGNVGGAGGGTTTTSSTSSGGSTGGTGGSTGGTGGTTSSGGSTGGTGGTGGMTSSGGTGGM